MRNYIYLFLLLCLFLNIELPAGAQHFITKTVSFNTNSNDEFSPVFYKGGIVFCSNQKGNSFISYRNGQKRLFKIFYVSKKDSSDWKYPKILAKEISTNFNDGPATFNKACNIMFYSRNHSIKSSLKNVSNPANKIGIYSAELIDGIWTNINPFTHNNPEYSLGTPALTADGKRIYFSSNMPGGFGQMDLYYCDWQNNEWSRPVNLGSLVNTYKNESFPFAGISDKLFFASDGHEGFGGKDLYYTQEIDGNWITPIHLDSTINSAADDFGLVTDSVFENGYFSSSRRKTDDIFSFKKLAADVEFPPSEGIIENNYCFTLYDEQYLPSDSVPVKYQWDFGDGLIRNGAEVKHCFPGPGSYSIKLSIIDQVTNEPIIKQFDYEVVLDKTEQAYISSYNVGIVNNSMTFDANKSYLNNYRIVEYHWNFGEGEGFEKATSTISKRFKEKGDYTIELGIIAREDSLGTLIKKSIMKKIKIYDSYEEYVLKSNLDNSTNAIHKQNSKLQIRFFFMDGLSKNQISNILEVIKKSDKSVIKFDQYGVLPSSYPFLDNIAHVLKKDSRILLEIAVHTNNDESQSENIEISEKWAQELSFFLKNNEISRNAYKSQGFGSSYFEFKSITPITEEMDGVIKFIFRKAP